jgi:hypothetical protein
MTKGSEQRSDPNSTSVIFKRAIHDSCPLPIVGTESARAMVLCSWCQKTNAALRRPKTGATICKECFYEQFELEVHQTITENKLFKAGDKVAIAASGGKGAHALARNASFH